MNATITKVRKIQSSPERFQVLYFTDRWHEDPNVCIDRAQANRRAAELKRS